jgi:uncharacterized protein (DUF362 family)
LRFAVKKINPGRQRKTVAIIKGKPSKTPSESAYSTTMKAMEILYENDRSFENSTYEIYRKTVMIKPNLPMPPGELGSSNMINTDPQACRAAVDWMIEKEAKRIIIAESNIWKDQDIWDLCGYREVFATKPYKNLVEFVDLNTDDPEEMVEIEYEMARDFYTEQDLAFLKGFLEGREATKKSGGIKVAFDQATSTSASFNKVLKEVNVMVNLPKMKTHVQTGASLTVNNHFGFLQPTESRIQRSLGMDPLQRNLSYTELIISSLHLQRAIACTAAAFKSLRIPQLCLVDGIICQEGNGPLNAGKARGENVIVAAWNCPPTIDTAVTQRFMGLSVDNSSYLPPHIQWASRLGLGTRDLEEVCLVLAREDGIPASSVAEMRNEPDQVFTHPATLTAGCSPRVFPRDTLLPVMTRALDELQNNGVDPNKIFPVVRRKVKLPPGTISS